MAADTPMLPAPIDTGALTANIGGALLQQFGAEIKNLFQSLKTDLLQIAISANLAQLAITAANVEVHGLNVGGQGPQGAQPPTPSPEEKEKKQPSPFLEALPRDVKQWLGGLKDLFAPLHDALANLVHVGQKAPKGVKRGFRKAARGAARAAGRTFGPRAERFIMGGIRGGGNIIRSIFGRARPATGAGGVAKAAQAAAGVSPGTVASVASGATQTAGSTLGGIGGNIAGAILGGGAAAAGGAGGAGVGAGGAAAAAGGAGGGAAGGAAATAGAAAGAAALASNPVGWVMAAVGSVAVLGVAVATTAINMQKFSEALLESQRGLAQFSASMAMVFAESDMRKFMRNRDIGESTAGSARYLANAQNDLADNTAEIVKLFAGIKNYVTGFFDKVLSWLVAPLNAIAKILNEWFGFTKEKDTPQAMFEWLERTAREAQQRRQANDPRFRRAVAPST